MLDFTIDLMYKTYAYRFIKGPQSPPAQVYSLGWETQTSSDYDWHGMKRDDESGNCVFQYTLSGFGVIEVNNQRHILNKGTAFITTVPSNHRYYLPDNSEKWEFIFITLTGKYAISQWQEIQKHFGMIMKFEDQEDIIKYLWEAYWDASNNRIDDGYQTSAIAYEFIMKLYSSLNSQLIKDNPNNNNITNSIKFMKDNLHTELCLDDIARVATMSKFHFNHSFTKSVGISPWNYLTKLRVEKAVKLLLSSNITVDEISNMVGYSSSNYFNKVFRKYVGTSPGKLRKKYRDVKDFTFSL